ncbi:MAG TPA: hypothetical protein VL563_01100 [Gemmatimonadales bacterium]|nr:hypothetical protein [Gemmatimonadales bacterium]
MTFVAENICEPQDLVDTGLTLEQMVCDLIESEGILGIADIERVVSVEEIP